MQGRRTLNTVDVYIPGHCAWRMLLLIRYFYIYCVYSWLMKGKWCYWYFDIDCVHSLSTKGENSKAAEARSRKASAQAEAEHKKQQAIEDEYWRDDDKHVAKKQQRKVTSITAQPISHWAHSEQTTALTVSWCVSWSFVSLMPVVTNSTHYHTRYTLQTTVK